MLCQKVSARKSLFSATGKPERVIQALDVDTIYAVPASYHEQGFDEQVVRYFNLAKSKKPNLSRWHTIVKRIREPESEVTIAIVGKYTSMLDSYKSLSDSSSARRYCLQRKS